MKPLVLYLPRRGTLPPPLPVTRDDVPVLLLHGYLGSPGNFGPTARALQQRGTPALGFEFGHRGTDRLDDSLNQIAHFARTIPSERFDIVGHSQGGLLGLRLAHLPEFQPRIRRIVGLGASFKGINVNYPAWLDPIAAAIGGPAAPYLRGKGFHEATIPDGVEVVSIVSTADRIVRPDNATLGHVITIDGVPHSRMPELAGPVIKALDMKV